jgi:nucleoside-diphosphate-sugar epimerase
MNLLFTGGSGYIGSHTALTPLRRAPAGDGLLESAKAGEAYCETWQVKMESPAGEDAVW